MREKEITIGGKGFDAMAVYEAIIAALDSRFHLIGSVIEGEARKEAMRLNIKDRGDFIQALGYVVQRESDGLNLIVGSNVPHEPYVLGGKVPSWTPFEPIKGWVERRGLSWTDKETGRALTVAEMAWMIIHTIRKRGIPARNIFATVIDNREKWIFEQLDNLELVL